MPDSQKLVTKFNEAINRRDVAALADLMSTDHTFIDSQGDRVVGERAALEAWQSFFVQYPDYRNHFISMYLDGNRVAVAGYSSCSNKALSGPTLWSAITADGQVSEWRVYEDNPENREMLGLVD